MPVEAPTIVPPAAPSAPPKPGAPSAFPSSTGEIHVTPPTPGGEAPAPKKSDTPKGKLFEALEKKASGKAAPPATPAKPAEAPAAARPAEKTPAEAPAAAAAEAGKTAEAPTDPNAALITPEERKEKPWKLVEKYKGETRQLRTEIETLKKAQLNPEERKAMEERITKSESRVQELEKYLTFVDYSQTEEFKTKYQQPYEKAWGRAMDDLRELTVTDANGTERPVDAKDILQIVNMPLAKARQIAQEVFGDFADDVMAHRKEIRSLFDAQAAALEDAKKNGQDRVKQAQEEAKRNGEALQKTIVDTWKSENDAVLKNEKIAPLFTPREGDDKWNNALQQGYELVDSAFSVNPADPKLTPEQRTAAIRRHAAVRNRAASWGALKVEVDQLRATLKAAQDELAQYKGSEPPVAGGGKTNAPAPEGGDPKQRMFAELKKRAK